MDLKGYEALPPWVKAGSEPDPSLREPDSARNEYEEKRAMTAGQILDSAYGSSGTSTAPGKEKTLDDWLAESGEEETEEEEDDEEESEGTEEESGEEESENEEEDEK
ncbi:hypothetical protein DID88_005274 [Monilinia fructigena]|uniref:Uncharacterized protein n=1 Tax=Monilinia fructigena TaxID=38457 RepID=A0A395IZC9_9HELO|nr:hypothetical protein DID88_005274 [Monilinia fructigena]